MQVQGKGRVKPKQLEQQVTELEQAVPDLAHVHRLRFHLAMDQEDYTTAIEALQRYFDYSYGEPFSHFRATNFRTSNWDPKGSSKPVHP